MLSRRFTASRKIEGMAKFVRVKATGWPRLINLEVTKLCNARCDFCPCWEIKDHPQLADYSEIMRKFRPIVLSLNGGEPLLRKDLMRVIDQVRPYVTYLTVITHGQLLTEEKYEELLGHGVDQLSISLNYLGSRHDEERKLKGLFQHFSDLVPRLTKKGHDNITFNTVIMDKNLDQIVPIAKQAHQWGAKVSFSAYTALKNHKEEYTVREPRLKKLEETIDEILSLRKTQGNIVTSEYYLKRIPRYFKEGFIENCRAGLNFIQMTPDGYIKRCSEMPVFFHWTEYHPDKVPENPCNVCWLSCRGETETPITPKRLWEFIKH